VSQAILFDVPSTGVSRNGRREAVLPLIPIPGIGGPNLQDFMHASNLDRHPSGAGRAFLNSDLAEILAYNGHTIAILAVRHNQLDAEMGVGRTLTKPA
jgi:hypothetical protein